MLFRWCNLWITIPDLDREERFVIRRNKRIKGVDKKELKNKGKTMSKLFKKLKQGLDEAIAYREGKVTLKSEFIELPKSPKEFKAKEIKKIREK